MAVVYSYPSIEDVLLFATYLILIGSILAFAIYEFVTGVAFQVLLLVLGGVGFAFLIAKDLFVLPSSFISFLGSFSIPLITEFVLVLIYMGTGLKLGLDAKQLRGSGLRIAAGGIVMAVADIVGSSAIFAYLCGIFLHWPWALGALFGALIGETSAAMVIPYLSHLTNLSAERSGKTEHMTKLTSVIKLESTMNSVVLLLFVTIFFNQLQVGNASPTFPVFINTALSSLGGVLAYNAVILFFVLAGIPFIIFISSKIIVFFVKKRLGRRNESGIEPYAVLYLKNPNPTSPDDVVIHRSSDVTEFSEKQMRIGMILYGIVLGIALLVFELVLKITSFAGFANILFALIALIYLGFFIGFLFPGGDRNSFENDASAKGKRTFTGMLLFHDEIELLARIVFYFSVGIELGTMLFSPPQGLQPIPGNEVLGALELMLVMVPVFLALRFFSGLFGLPMAFYSRHSKEKFRGDFKLVAATMPKGVTVAAISILLLQANVESGGTIYILALSTIIISTFAFTIVSSLGSSVLKAATRKVDAGAVLTVGAAPIAGGSDDSMPPVQRGGDSFDAGKRHKVVNIEVKQSLERIGRPFDENAMGAGRSIESGDKEDVQSSGGSIEEVLPVKIYQDVTERLAMDFEEGMRHLDDRLTSLEGQLTDVKRGVRTIESGPSRKSILREVRDAISQELGSMKDGIAKLGAGLEALTVKVQALREDVDLKGELKSGIQQAKDEMKDKITDVVVEVRSLSQKMNLEERLERKIESLSEKRNETLDAQASGAAEDKQIAEARQLEEESSRSELPRTPVVMRASIMRFRHVIPKLKVRAEDVKEQLSAAARGMEIDSVLRQIYRRVNSMSILVGFALYATAFLEFRQFGMIAGYLILVPGSVLMAAGIGSLFAKQWSRLLNGLRFVFSG